jgi:hypothetical protein
VASFSPWLRRNTPPLKLVCDTVSVLSMARTLLTRCALCRVVGRDLAYSLNLSIGARTFVEDDSTVDPAHFSTILCCRFLRPLHWIPKVSAVDRTVSQLRVIRSFPPGEGCHCNKIYAFGQANLAPLRWVTNFRMHTDRLTAWEVWSCAVNSPK